MPSATSSQTIGPFWHLIEHPEWADLTRFGAAGARVTLSGSVVDGDGNPVTDAAVELWQADPSADESFRCESADVFGLPNGWSARTPAQSTTGRPTSM